MFEYVDIGYAGQTDLGALWLVDTRAYVADSTLHDSGCGVYLSGGSTLCETDLDFDDNSIANRKNASSISNPNRYCRNR